MSDGATTGSKKPHYAEALKAEIAAQKAEIASLKAEMAGAPVTLPPDPFVPSDAPHGYDIDNDPLGFIDENVEEVYLVGKMFALPGWTQRRHRGLEIGKDVADFVKAVGQRKWVMNPFRFKGTYQQIKDLRTMTSRHWYHIIDRPMAQYIYSFAKNPLPDRAIVAVEDYGGVNAGTGMPVGNKSPCSNDPVREFVRFCLQANPGSLWIDKAYFIEDDRLDKMRPNPYSSRYEVSGIGLIQTGGPESRQSADITDLMGDVVVD